jgi:thiol-disulfide isomerase/thioredoxin
MKKKQMNPKNMDIRSSSTMLRTGLRGVLLALLLVVPFSAYAADFTLKDMQGKTQRLADYRGKWVLVNFWATWCPPCLNEIPELISLHKAHKNKDLVVIGIAVDSGSAKAVADFVKTHGISYPMVMEDDKSRQQLGEMDLLPTSFLYSPAGELVSYQQGEVTRGSVEAYIKNRK